VQQQQWSLFVRHVKHIAATAEQPAAFTDVLLVVVLAALAFVSAADSRGWCVLTTAIVLPVPLD
jgi:hypothetical protein